jgi:hypothetical protein
MEFYLPPDQEFAERSFWRSETKSTGAPFDWPVAEYVREYADGLRLALSFCPSDQSVEATLSGPLGTLCQIYLDSISEIAFQSWHGERIVRLTWQNNPNRRCIRIHYEPVPRIVVEAT